MKMWLIRFLFVQITLTFFSLLILTQWGIPLSLAAFVGNFIFAPVASLYLGISCLCLLLQVLSCDTSFLIRLLELVTGFWTGVIAWLGDGFIIPLPAPHKGITLFLFFCMCGILAAPYSKGIKTTLMSLLLCVTVASLSLWARSKKGLLCITSGKKGALLLTVQNKTILIDNGELPKKGGKIDQWIRFQLKPELVKERGRYTVDLLILKRKKNSTYEEERIKAVRRSFSDVAKKII